MPSSSASLHLLALALATLAAAPAPSRAAPLPVVSFEDASNDATGPGSYTPPGDPGYQDGDFDLRRFAVVVVGDDVLFVVTLGAAPRPPALAVQDGSTPLHLQNGVYQQNVDIYVDTDPASGEGTAACIPGRRVTFADGRTWKAAVVLTPQPGLARAVTEAALGPLAARVTFAEPLQVRGRTITARVPAARLGGTPKPSWGWSVQVSGARWEGTYAATGRFKGTHQPDAFTLPVRTTPEAFAFGGAPTGEAHPRVVDLLLPPGADQARVLGSFDRERGTYAAVPFVYTVPPPAPPAAPSAAAAVDGEAPTLAAASPPSQPAASSPPQAPVLLPPELMPRLDASRSVPTPPPTQGAAGPITVVDVTDDLVSARGPVAGLQPMQFGRVVDGQGVVVARVLILRLVDQGLLASAIAGKERIRPGARLLFDPPAPAP